MDYIFDNERPIYIQLVEMIRIEIVSGKFKKGQKIGLSVFGGGYSVGAFLVEI